MKWYWFSFSFEGANQGCCNVQAVSQEAALQKTIDLGIHPRHDDIEVYVGEGDGTPELEPDRLYSPDEMEKRGNERVKYNKEERGNNGKS
jgi:hypothetical protein